MPAGENAIKGIGLKVTIDASKVEGTFNEAIGRIKGRKINLTISADFDKASQTRLANLRNQKIPVELALSPNRESIRDFRRIIKQRIGAEGRIPVPVTITPPTQAEGAAIRTSILKSIGSPKVELLLSWKWTDGPPPVGFYRGGGGGGGGGGAQQAVNPAAQRSGAPEQPQERAIRSRGARQPRGTRQQAQEVAQELQEEPKPRRQTREERRRERQEQFPERINVQTGDIERGGPDLGPLASDVRRAIPRPGAEPTSKIDLDQIRNIFFARQAPDIGFRAQRASRSPFGPGTGLTPEEQEKHRAANRARVEAGKETVEGSFDEIFKTMPADFQKAFTKGIGLVEQGDLPLAKQSLGASLDDLLARGRGGKIKGVGPRTVNRILDPTKGLETLKEGPNLEAQQDFAFQYGALRDLISSIGTIEAENQKKRRRRRKQPDLSAIDKTPLSKSEVSDVMARARASLVPGDEQIAESQPTRARRGRKQEERIDVTGGVAPQEPTGGGGDVLGFFGGGEGGGAIPVSVQNWPGSLTGEGAGFAAAAQDVGTPSSRDFEKVFNQAAENLAAAAEKIGATGAAPKKPGVQAGGRARLGPTGRLIGTPRSEINRAARSGTITQEQADELFTESGPQTGIDAAIAGVQEQLAQARQGLPIRSFPVSIAQTFAGGKRGAAIARFQQAGEKLSDAKGLATENERLNKILDLRQTQYDNINEKVDKGKKLTAEEKKLQESIPDDLSKIGKQIEENTNAYEGLVGEAGKLAKLTTGERVGNLARSLVGSIGGVFAYTAALGAVGVAGGAFVKILDDTTERSNNYARATQAINNNLAQQVRASQGAVETTVAQTAAQTNLSEAIYDTIKASLEQRATVQAGNQAFDEQIKLQAASQNNQRAQRGGFDKGLFETTGGFTIPFLGTETPIGGTPSTQELIARDIERIPQQKSYSSLVPQIGAVRAQEEVDKRAAAFGDTLDLINDKFKGTGVRFVDSTDKMAASVADTVDALDRAGFEDLAKEIRGRGDIALTQQGAGLSADQLRTAVQQFAERNARPDPAVLLQGLQERVIPALQFGIQQNLQNQLKIFIPGQRGLQFARQPVAPFGRGLVPGEGAGVSGINVGGEQRFAGVPQAALRSFSEYRDRAQEAIDAVTAKATAGQQVLIEKLGVPRSTLATLTSLGTEIDVITQKQADIQLDVQFSQYNRQLFIAKRTLGDLAGLIGAQGATNVGLLQREGLLLSRQQQLLGFRSQQLGLQTGELQQQSSELGHQAQALQLELSQRQINFQRAIAGFGAPGLTFEERHARIEEAKVEADYAQRQLDFQRQQFRLQGQQIRINKEQLAYQREAFALAQASYENQVKLQDALNSRAYQDQADALAELEKSFASQQEIQALQGVKDALAQQADQITQEIQAQIAAETEFIQAQAQFTTDLLTQTGQFVTGTVTKVGQVFTAIANSFAKSELGRYLNTPITNPGGPGTGGGAYDPETGTYRAEGYVGSASKPTTVTYGEAGTEMVAIIRNPRSVLAGGSMTSGGTTVYAPIQISLYGTSMRNEADIKSLAVLLQGMIEQRMGRRMSALGAFADR